MSVFLASLRFRKEGERRGENMPVLPHYLVVVGGSYVGMYGDVKGSSCQPLPQPEKRNKTERKQESSTLTTLPSFQHRCQHSPTARRRLRRPLPRPPRRGKLALPTPLRLPPLRRHHSRRHPQSLHPLRPRRLCRQPPRLRHSRASARDASHRRLCSVGPQGAPRWRRGG